jgi:5-methylcytosine-specific restriction protein B
MTEYEKFKKILEYFVAHLEWCVNEDINHIGYINYIKPLIDNNTFKYTGQGYSGNNIQQQIKSWCDYENGLIHINIQQNFGSYQSTKCYLNWDWTGLNVNAKWANDHIESLYLNKYDEDTGNNVLGFEKSLIDLGLYENRPPNNNLITLFDRYNSLIINWNIMEELKKVSI